MKKNIPQKIGHGFAYLQDAIDRMVTFGFRSLKNYGKTEPEPTAPPIKKAIHEVSSFLGEMGTEYYDKYSQIKEERAREEMQKRSKKKTGEPARKRSKKAA